MTRPAHYEQGNVSENYPEVVPDSSQPEVVPSSDPEVYGYYPQGAPPPGYYKPPEEAIVGQKNGIDEKRICGVRKKRFWIIFVVVVVIVLIAAIVGGVVGGIQAGKDKNTDGGDNKGEDDLNSPSGKIRKGSSIAMIENSAGVLKLYSQDIHGFIFESTLISGVWSNTSLVKALPDTPIAIASWGEMTNIRLYYISERHHISEHAYRNSNKIWKPSTFGGTSSPILAANQTKLAATAIDNSGHYRLLYQTPENKITEYIYTFSSSVGWSPGSTFDEPAVGGSALAVVQGGSGNQVRLFYQAENGTIIERNLTDAGNNEWTVARHWPPFPFQTPLTAVSWRNNTKTRLFGIENNHIITSYLDTNGSSSTTTNTPSPKKTITADGIDGARTSLTATVQTDGMLSMRVYWQDLEGLLKQVYWTLNTKVWQVADV